MASKSNAKQNLRESTSFWWLSKRTRIDELLEEFLICLFLELQTNQLKTPSGHETRPKKKCLQALITSPPAASASKYCWLLEKYSLDLMKSPRVFAIGNSWSKDLVRVLTKSFSDVLLPVRDSTEFSRSLRVVIEILRPSFFSCSTLAKAAGSTFKHTICREPIGVSFMIFSKRATLSGRRFTLTATPKLVQISSPASAALVWPSRSTSNGIGKWRTRSTSASIEFLRLSRLGPSIEIV